MTRQAAFLAAPSAAADAPKAAVFFAFFPAVGAAAAADGARR
ncbi:hypothetical protein [Streptomyces sp. MP131-18]|nr:hypothetical protein [Streptomyces sp. MP131-18]